MFLTNCKTHLNTLIIDYNTLLKVLEDRRIDYKSDFADQILSKHLQESLKKIRLVDLPIQNFDNLGYLVKYLNIDSISLGLKSSDNNHLH